MSTPEMVVPWTQEPGLPSRPSRLREGAGQSPPELTQGTAEGRDLTAVMLLESQIKVVSTQTRNSENISNGAAIKKMR